MWGHYINNEIKRRIILKKVSKSVSILHIDKRIQKKQNVYFIRRILTCRMDF